MMPDYLDLNSSFASEQILKLCLIFIISKMEIPAIIFYSQHIEMVCGLNELGQ